MFLSSAPELAARLTALRLAENPKRRVTIITRDPDEHESNTLWAQGGIISRGPDDSADLLVKDILEAAQVQACPLQRASLPKKVRPYWRKF